MISIIRRQDCPCAKIVGLGQAIDQRFAQVDRRFDELKAQLRVEIEALGTRLTTAFDGIIAAAQNDTANREAHVRFEQQLERHDLRLTALERGDRRR